MDGARIKCSLCSKPEGELKVTSNTLNLQEMLWANINDTNGAQNLIFNGVCNHSRYGDKKPPCQSVIQLGGWTNPASAIVQDAPGVLKESQNFCTIHDNQAIEIVHTGQTTTPTNLHEIEEEEVGELVLVEEGRVKLGHWINEESQIVITDSNLNRAYDWEYADSPSERVMNENGLSGFDIYRINNLKELSETELKMTFWGTLFLNSDAGDFGATGRKVANHFISGGGVPLIFDESSKLAQEIKGSSDFESFLEEAKDKLKTEFENHNKINDDKCSIKILSRRDITLPYYSPGGAFNPNVNEAATIIGGIQAALIYYEIYQDTETLEVVVEIPQVIFLDTFGAGWEDGGAYGWKKQWIPGLVQMFVLQHFKNVSDPTKYRPFTIGVSVNPN